MWAMLLGLVAYALNLPAGISGVGGVHSHDISGVAFETFAKIQVDNLDIPFVGWGTREKTFGFFSINVYGAAHYRAPEGFPRALQLVFLRPVDRQKIRAAYEQGLQDNSVDLSTPQLQELLALLSQDTKKGDWVWLVGPDANSLLVINRKGSERFTQPRIAHDLFSIWFGASKDSGLQSLKTSLLSQSHP